MTAQDLAPFFQTVAQDAQARGAFGELTPLPAGIMLQAEGAAEPAFYRLEETEDGLWLSLGTKDRWLSESIEADLMNTGDKLEELLDDELVELGIEGLTLSFEHYRSDDLEYIFRVRTPDEVRDPGAVGSMLIAFERCFRNLGDMDAGGED